jgi:class 3 adenylate cyclase
VGLGFALATWQATRGIDTANFRRRVALAFAFVLGVGGILELAMQSSMWGLNIIPSLNDQENRWFVRKVLEASMASFGIAIALEWAIVVRDRQTVLQRFGMIVDPRVLKELVRNKKIPTVRAEQVVALFVDLRGFTTLCEKESPQEVNLTLNEYLEVVTKAVQEHGGVIDKFVGDEVMALWGVPEQSDSDPTNAVRSAVSIRRRLRDLNTLRRRAGRDELAVGIGLHCGPAIVGPVGSAERIDFTAIGPTINLAARLQSLTKEKKSDILISSDLYQLVSSSALVTDLGPIKIRGMEKPVTLYRVLGVTDDSGKMHIHDKTLEAAGLPSTPGIATDAPDNLFKAS